MPSATCMVARTCYARVFGERPSHVARCLQVFIGDYIDRGPDSRQTIDLLIERGRRHEAIFLKGNHEAFLLEVFQDTARLEAWKDYGGFQTLMSYGLAPSLRPDREEQAELVQALQIAMPAEHRQFFRSLRKSFVCGDFFFAHAGAPKRPIRILQISCVAIFGSF